MALVSSIVDLQMKKKFILEELNLICKKVLIWSEFQSDDKKFYLKVVIRVAHLGKPT